MKRHSSIVFILCMKLLVALAVQSASATPSHNYLSDDCKKLLTDHKIEKPSYNLFKLVNDQSNYLPVIISRLDKDTVKIEAVSYKDDDNITIYGLKFTLDNKSIVDCRSFYHTPKISLVEKIDYYTMFLIERKDALRISTNYFINCGSGCFLSHVYSVYFLKNDTSPPWVRTEITSAVHEYPSQWFADYLTLEELFKFANTEKGLAGFQWRGKVYETRELRKLYNK